MGSFDGAEMCELVGCYILALLTEKYGRNIGLYCDDGLAAFNGKPHEIEKIKKELCKIFRDNDLKITVEGNKTKVNFLDVTLDLRSGKYWPYTKEGNIPLYVHRKSNHPPSILKNIPESKHFMAFVRTLVIALTIHVGIMRICCCPVQIFAIY